MEYTTFFSEAAARLEDAAFWLDSHGISIDTARRLRVGYDAEQATGPSLIVPTGKESYFAINLADDSAVEVGAQRLFCSCTLDNGMRPVFVVEDVLSALAIIDAGGEACAVCGMDSARALLESAIGAKNPARLLLAVEATGKLSVLLQTLSERLSVPGVACTPVNVLCGQMSASMALVANREAFIKALRETEAQALGAPDGIGNYLKYLFPDDIAKFAKNSAIKTGFRRFDDLSGGLFPGLYVIAAVPSLGKTTFISQMADQIAASGTHCLLFSLEMGRLEMASKSLARICAQIADGEINKAPSSMAIRRGEGGELAKWARDEYIQNIGDRMSVIEGGFRVDIRTLTSYVMDYIARNNVRPVVFVDYLQVVKPAPGEYRADRRETTDNIVEELKRLSTAASVPIIAVSSLNRANYLAPVDFESIKESGGVEYGADVVLGFQLACLDEDLFKDEKAGVIKKRERVREAKGEEPRSVKVSCLKSRYSAIDWSVYFDYYAAHDWFVEKDAPPVSALDDLKKRVNGKR